MYLKSGFFDVWKNIKKGKFLIFFFLWIVLIENIQKKITLKIKKYIIKNIKFVEGP